jgi:hypothetical protein
VRGPKNGLKLGIPENRTRVTGLLLEWGGATRVPWSDLIPLVYRELHQVAVTEGREGAGHSLQRRSATRLIGWD